MKYIDLEKMYQEIKLQYKEDAYKHISGLLQKAKKVHYQDWQKNPTLKGDHEQSWRAFKGKNFEKLVRYIIENEVKDLGLKVINGTLLERKEFLSEEYSRVKRNVAVNFGEYGLHLPDVDLIIYQPTNYKVVAVISTKVTLRERIAQTGYWKLKLFSDEATKHIKVFFITLDEDGTLLKRWPIKKGRAIVEKDLDASYVLTDEPLEESKRVKLFEHFIDDLRGYLE